MGDESGRKKLVVLELYSGIGGMHFAFTESGIPFEVVTAIDINEISNSIYRHNFPQTRLRSKCLATLTLSELESFSADLVTMSPPCQPFTRVGKQRDVVDERTKSLLNFLDLLPKLSKIPDYILLENVKGFETSLTRDATVRILDRLDFAFQEFLLTPLQFSIPNSRLRYYLLAKRRPLTFNFNVQPEIQKTLPHLSADPDNVRLQIRASSAPEPERLHSNDASSEKSTSTDTSPGHDASSTSCHGLHTSHKDSGSGHDPSEWKPPSSDVANTPVALPVARLLSEYLEDQPNEYFRRYLLPKKFYRYFWVMDLVEKNSRKTCCFTKRYGHHVEGAGSVVQMTASQRDLTEFRTVGGMMAPECAEGIEALQLRFFTPREIANLMCFPLQFDFPDNVTTLQSYRALGNSINVHIVSRLLRILAS